MILDFFVRFDNVTCLKDCGNILYKFFKKKNNKFKVLITINAYITNGN